MLCVGPVPAKYQRKYTKWKLVFEEEEEGNVGDVKVWRMTNTTEDNMTERMTATFDNPDVISSETTISMIHMTTVTMTEVSNMR